jgi:hypothetical protein
LGAPAKPPPPPLGHPPLSDSVVLPVPGTGLNAGNTHGIARAPAPLGAGMARRGAAGYRKTRQFVPGPVDPASPFVYLPKFFRQFWFLSGTFLELSHFKPKKIRPENFRAKIF